MKKKTLYPVLALVALALTGTIAFTVASNAGGLPFLKASGGGETYSITLDSSNQPAGFSDQYAAQGQTIIPDKGVTLNYRLGKIEAESHVTLAPHGYICNDPDASTDKNKITGLVSVSVNASSSLSIRTNIRPDGHEFGAPQSLPIDGTPYLFADEPSYFIIEAGDSASKITDLTFTYACDLSDDVYLSQLEGEYTGVGTDEITYKLTINGSNASIESLNHEPPQIGFNGTAAIVDGNKVQATLDIAGNPGIYTCAVSADHRALTYSSKSGAAAGFPNIDFYKVYKVEDFESYSALGNGFGGSGRTTAASLFTMSGLKSQWHADYYAGSGDGKATSLYGDSGWKVMGSADYQSFTTTKGHNSSKAASFKGNNNGLRYAQMKAPLGLPNIIGKGTKLSFWAKAYSDSGLSTVKTSDTTMRVDAFYDQRITYMNISHKEAINVTIPGSSDWARYTIDLDSSKEYYSFGFYDNKGSQVYLVVDDVEIYTVDPYAEYVAPVAVTGVDLTPSSASLTIGNTQQLTATISPAEATNKDVFWESDDPTVASVDNDGLVTALKPGSATITVETDDGGFTDTCEVTVNGLSYPEGTFMANVSSYKLTIAIGNSTNNLVSVKISTADAVATGITYTPGDHSFEITTTGSVSGYSVGTISGEYDPSTDSLIHVGCSGDIGAVVSDVTLTRPGNLFTFEGTTEELRTQYKRRYHDGSNWQVDTGNSDRIVSETTTKVSGNSAMSVRPCGTSFTAYGFVLNSDFATAKTLGSIQFWVYNPCNTDIKFRIYYYKSTGLSNAGQVGLVESDVAKANSWSYIARGFTSSAIYNINISVWKADQSNQSTTMTARLIFDDLLLF